MPWVRIARAFERLRRWRVFGYLTLAVTGLGGLYDPPSVLSSNTGDQTARVLALVWVVGGFVCALSVLRGRIDGELIFLRVISGSFFIFAFVLFVQAHLVHDTRVAVYGGVMVSFGAMLWALWGVVDALANFQRGAPDAD